MNNHNMYERKLALQKANENISTTLHAIHDIVALYPSSPSEMEEQKKKQTSENASTQSCEQFANDIKEKLVKPLVQKFDGSAKSRFFIKQWFPEIFGNPNTTIDKSKLSEEARRIIDENKELVNLQSHLSTILEEKMESVRGESEALFKKWQETTRLRCALKLTLALGSLTYTILLSATDMPSPIDGLSDLIDIFKNNATGDLIITSTALALGAMIFGLGAFMYYRHLYLDTATVFQARSLCNEAMEESKNIKKRSGIFNWDGRYSAPRMQEICDRLDTICKKIDGGKLNYDGSALPSNNQHVGKRV